MKAVGDGNVKNVRIGIIYTVSNYLLPKILSNFESKEDGIDFSFFEDKTVNLIKDLNVGKLDGILLAFNKSCKKGEFEISSNVKEHNLYKEKLLVVMHQNHEFNSQNKKVSNKEFKEIASQNQFILLEEGNCLTNHVNDIAMKYNLDIGQKKSNLFKI